MNLVELGLVAKMNLVELGLVGDIYCRWTRIGVMAADMWWRIWTRIGGRNVVVVYGSGDEGDATAGWQPVNRTRNSKGLDAKTINLTR